PGVGHADHLDVADGRVPVEELLDLAWIDVLAAADDHVLDPADDVGVAVGVHGRQVAGVHPARLVDGLAGGLGVVPVAEHDHVPAGAQLARGVAGDDPPAVGVDDLDLDVRVNPAYGGDPLVDRVV